MPDIKRNNDTPSKEGKAHGDVKEDITRKPLSGNFVKPNNIQVHFGNVEGLKLKLLEGIGVGIQNLCDILDPDGKIRREVEEKRDSKGK